MFKIDMDYIFENYERPTERYVEEKMRIEKQVRTYIFSEREQKVYDYDRKYAKNTDKIPDVGRISNSVNLPVNSVRAILDKIEDKLYYKYLDM